MISKTEKRSKIEIWIVAIDDSGEIVEFIDLVAEARTRNEAEMVVDERASSVGRGLSLEMLRDGCLLSYA
jgi:hypothetical protein